MSDPVTNFAIEDVLTSIRRLVSEGDRSTKLDIFSQPAPQFNPAPPVSAVEKPPQAPVIADKFMLTPALRISEIPVSDAGARPVLAAQSTPALPPINFTKAPQHIFKAAIHPPESRSPLEQRIAELEAAVTDQAGDWEPDGSEEVPVVDWSSVPPGDGFVFASRATPLTDRSGVLDLGKVGTRIHPVITESEPEPDYAAGETYDQGEDLDLSGIDMTDDHMAAYLDQAEPDQSVLNEVEKLDEAALRQLVIDMVRQELQGPLGERITRNVRKMVRREIYRVLSSQEIES